MAEAGAGVAARADVEAPAGVVAQAGAEVRTGAGFTRVSSASQRYPHQVW